MQQDPSLRKERISSCGRFFFSIDDIFFEFFLCGVRLPPREQLNYIDSDFYIDNEKIWKSTP